MRCSERRRASAVAIGRSVGAVAELRSLSVTMTLGKNRVLSGLLAVSYIIVAVFFGGAEVAFKTGMFVTLPLACIWFSEAMGGFVGPNWRGAITSPTPAVFVCMGGWLLLLLPLVIWIGYAF